MLLAEEHDLRIDSPVFVHTEVPLSDPVPIFINYWTAWSGEDSVSFFEDIYGIDSAYYDGGLYDPVAEAVQASSK